MSDADRLLPVYPPGDLDEYVAAGGGRGLARAVELSPGEVVDEVEAAGLRGRGGAGFPTATKWRGVLGADLDGGLALVANAAEGEPATFKDRTLLAQQPYAFLEGLCIALHATGAGHAYVGIKAKFTGPRARLGDALAECVAAGWPGAERVEIVDGPDAYLFGEETGLLEVIEGKLPMPRIVKPYEAGLFATTTSPQPTVVNNVETLSHVATILARGADWFRGAGTEASPGTMVFTVVGDVQSPGVYELALGTPLRTLLVDVAGAAEPKAVYGGVSNAVITDEHLDTPLCFDAMRDAGVGLGAGGFVVYGRERRMLDVLAVLVNFLAVESCGQCNACKLGTTAMADLLARAQRGRAEPGDLDVLAGWVQSVTDQNRCYLPVGAQLLVGSTLQAFGDELLATVAAGDPTPADVPTPLVDDIDEATGAVRFDERYHLKRYDWSYADRDPGDERLRALRGDPPAPPRP